MRPGFCPETSPNEITYSNTVGIKTDPKFLPTVAGTGLFKQARKSRIFLTKKLSVPFPYAICPFVSGPNRLRIVP